MEKVWQSERAYDYLAASLKQHGPSTSESSPPPPPPSRVLHDGKSCGNCRMQDGMISESLPTKTVSIKTLRHGKCRLPAPLTRNRTRLASQARSDGGRNTTSVVDIARTEIGPWVFSSCCCLLDALSSTGEGYTWFEDEFIHDRLSSIFCCRNGGRAVCDRRVKSVN